MYLSCGAFFFIIAHLPNPVKCYCQREGVVVYWEKLFYGKAGISMEMIQNQTFDAERALYGSRGAHVHNCRFDGPADGESAFKECRDIRVSGSYFNLRYPFWHDAGLLVENCELTPLCRAALWYTEDVTIRDTKMHGIKALRECGNVTMENCDVESMEFGWFTRGMSMTDCAVRGEYFMLRSYGLVFRNVTLKGKYSFQYIENSLFENCDFDTKDAFWHAKNVTVRNCRIQGEYLAWYCENVTFENCVISGTQPLCYCKGLKLVNCRMENADLCFERSQVEATVLSPVVSVKNPRSGYISLPEAELIFDDEQAKGVVVFSHQPDGEKARAILGSGDYTCVLCKDTAVHTTALRGVKPLVRWLESGADFSGFSAADKVVGRATAYLYRLLGVSGVYAQIMSEAALEVLKDAGIRAEYGSLVPNIINRKGDGICPFEAAVLNIRDAQAARTAIYAKMTEMGISLT